MKANLLTVRKIAKLNERGFYCDGGGLYLQVSKTGTKSWVFRYRFNNRVRDMGLGDVGTYSLEEARKRAREKRQLVKEGVDPIAQKEAAREQKKVENAKRVTFAECAAAVIEAKSRSPKWASGSSVTWRQTLRDYVLPVIGDLDVAAIELPHITKVLEPIFNESQTHGMRIRGRIEAVLNYATVRGFRKGDNPARWHGYLSELYSFDKGEKHHAAMPFSDVPAFMSKLRSTDTLNARALELIILTAVRKAEATGAKWSEIDLDNAAWTIPSSRTKSGKEHRVALSREAVGLLRSLPRTGEHVFAKGASPIPDRAPIWTLHSLDPSVTVHGFRSSFRDWAGETSDSPREVIEMALGHRLKDKAEAGYARGDLFTKRRKLMQGWADYCGSTPAEIWSMRGEQRNTA